MHHPTDKITHTTACYTSRGALAVTRNSSMGPPHEGSIRRPITPWANALPLSYVPLPYLEREQEREMFYLTMHSTHFIYGYMEREREMFYLTTHSTHFIYGYMEREREMFYLTTHSTHFIYGYMASDIWLRTILIVRKETCCRHIGYSYRLTAGFFYMHHPTDRITHTTAFVTPVVEHWLEREIAQWVHPMKERSDDPSHHELMVHVVVIEPSVLDGQSGCLLECVPMTGVCPWQFFLNVLVKT